MTKVNLISPLAAFISSADNDRQAQLDRMDYEDYLLSPEWDAIRSRKLEKAGYTCERCKKPAAWLDCHHLRYPQRGTETNKDLQAVCRACHKKIHGIVE